MGWTVPHWTLADRILKGNPIIVQDTGRSLWTVTHSDDFAVAFCGLLGNIQAIGHQFHITGDELLTWEMIMKTYGQVLGVEPNIVHVPVDFIAKVYPEKGAAIYSDMIENGVFDLTKLKKFVPGYHSTIPLREGLARSVKWYRDHPDKMIISEENNKEMDAILAAWK
jgi:nucleoside-diphosphate-sugar epimerase